MNLIHYRDAQPQASTGRIPRYRTVPPVRPQTMRRCVEALRVYLKSGHRTPPQRPPSAGRIADRPGLNEAAGESEVADPMGIQSAGACRVQAWGGRRGHPWKAADLGEGSLASLATPQTWRRQRYRTEQEPRRREERTKNAEPGKPLSCHTSVGKAGGGPPRSGFVQASFTELKRGKTSYGRYRLGPHEGYRMGSGPAYLANSLLVRLRSPT